MPAINKGRRPQLLSGFCIFSKKKHYLQNTWCSFWWNFLITSISSTHFCL